MKTLRLSLFATSVLLASGVTFANTFVEGKDYKLAPQVGKVDVPGKIEVREFFWYGCPHCHTLEPYMQKWLTTLPNDVNFLRTPAAMNPVWELHARAYYTSEALGMRRKVHLPMFWVMHEGRQRMGSQQEIAQFYTRYGADINKFNSLFNSFSITGKINQSKQLAAHYQLSGVPAIVVNGKYIVQGENQRTVDIVQFLVDKERNAMKKAS
ncbi:thiol:disulfide interchange protein DsbA/DsbL [Acinetobacter sp. c3-l95]|uniref:thiol:disulfide interchange protein DsbA/DsbL n=1 Tax=Acinetobacter sp. c3-l95 TaxID=3342804 RepID=UPI0035B920FA